MKIKREKRNQGNVQNITLALVDLGCGQIYVLCEPSTPRKQIPQVAIGQPRYLPGTKSGKTFCAQEETGARKSLRVRHSSRNR